LNCFYCTYRWAVHGLKKEEKFYPFDKLDRIVVLKPRAIVISGGGEPTLYRDSNKDFNDLVCHLAENIPGVRIGLTTNGAYVPPGDYIKYIEWVRVSLDASNEKTFKMLKDGSYDNRISVILQYLESPIKYVGVGFLYNRFNISEIPEVIRNIYDIVSYELGEKYIEKLNIQFRPTCPIESCDCPSKVYGTKSILMTPDLHEWWNKELIEVHSNINKLKNFKKISQFIEYNTNVSEIEPKYEKTRIPSFRHCYIALVRWIIRPNGDVYPCVMKASNRDQKIGNILRESFDDLTFKSYEFYELNNDYCKGSIDCCRITGELNEIVENNLDVVKLEGFPDDPFF